MKSNRWLIRTLLLTACLATSQAKAAIILVDSASYVSYEANTGATKEITAASLGAFSTLGDKLVVTIAGEGTTNGSGDPTVTSVKFGDVAMTLAVAAANGTADRTVSIWYLDLASASPVDGNFDVTFTGNGSGYSEGIGFAAYTLSGTKAGGPSSTSTSRVGSTTSIATTEANEFVITTAARNNWDSHGNGDANTNLVREQAPLTDVLFNHITTGTPSTSDTVAIAGPTAGYMAVSAYASYASPGTQTLTIYDLNNGTTAWATAAFQPIPEPSSLAMLVFGMLSLMVFRKRNG